MLDATLAHVAEAPSCRATLPSTSLVGQAAVSKPPAQHGDFVRCRIGNPTSPGSNSVPSLTFRGQLARPTPPKCGQV